MRSPEAVLAFFQPELKSETLDVANIELMRPVLFASSRVFPQQAGNRGRVRKSLCLKKKKEKKTSLLDSSLDCSAAFIYRSTI